MQAPHRVHECRVGMSEWLVSRGVCPVGLRHSGTVFTCGQRGAVSFPEARSKGPQRGGAALDGSEYIVGSFGCAGQPPVRRCCRRCRRHCARNLSVACAKVAFGRIVR